MDSEQIIGAVTSVTKKWSKQRKAEERNASRETRRKEVMTNAFRLNIKEAAWMTMGDDYYKASGKGTYPAKTRQIMYVARPFIQYETGKTLDDKYYTQILVPDYLAEHPDETAAWDVVFDARGHLQEPHTEKIVPLGTLEVRDYFEEIWSNGPSGLQIDLPKEFPTCGPENRYQAVLLIEKEGFQPLFRVAKLAERYDLAIMSTKGMSTTACRSLVDRLCGENDIPLLVVRDFDKAGFSIVGTLQRNNRRYQFTHDIEVIDLGLRLDDVEAYDLQSEIVSYKQSDPRPNLQENGATDQEVDFLCDNHTWHYSGQRVELNAFTSDQLIEWLESKLEQYGIRKVVPNKEVLEAAYRRALQIREIENFAKEAAERVSVVKVPPLIRKVRKILKDDPTLSWDEAVDRVAADDNALEEQQ